jgi:hypothetical protein
MGRPFNLKRFDVFEAYKDRIDYYDGKRHICDDYMFLYSRSIERLYSISKEYYFLIQDSNFENKKELLNRLNSEIMNSRRYCKKTNFVTMKYRKVLAFLKAPWLYYHMAKIKDKFLL